VPYIDCFLARRQGRSGQAHVLRLERIARFFIPR
jgi:hypothetical protein